MLHRPAEPPAALPGGVATDVAIERARDLAACKSPANLARRLDPKYQTRPHSELISKAVVAADRGQVDRVLITTPPQVGKSTAAAVWGAFWWLVHHPDQRVIVASYAASLATRRGRAVRKLIREHGARFGLHLERGAQAADDFELTTGGGMRCAGVDGGITGYDAGVIFADDLVKNRKQAESKTVRRAVEEFWSSSVMTRLSPTTPVFLIMTLWHPQDIGAHVIAQEGDRATGGRWLVLKCPAYATSDADVLGRKVGEPLTHPKIDPADVAALHKHWEDQRVGKTLRDWFAMYMCDPQPLEGALLTAEMLRERRHLTDLPARTVTAVAVDPSGGGEDTCGIIGGFTGTDGRLYVTDDETAVMAVDVWPRKACELAARIGAKRFVVETDFGARMGPNMIRTAWDALQREWDAEQAELPEAERSTKPNPYAGFCPRLVPKRAADMGNKLMRAEPVAQMVIEDRIRFAKYLPMVEHEWATYQPGQESPGRIDAMVWLAYDLLRPPATGKPTTSPADTDMRNVSRSTNRTAGVRINRDQPPGSAGGPGIRR